MIRILRDRLDEQTGQPIRPDAGWFVLAEASKEQALQDGSSHVVLDSVYGAFAVRKALEKLFHDKCAYCESNTTAGADWEVEHFRPKGRVAERRDDHPGYYWLAYEWENLYPSCQHCNQKRRDRPRWGDVSAATGPAKGKLDQFPLADEAGRAMSPGDDLTAEDRLLLDPTIDDPEEHIRFDVHGQALPVQGSPRGVASIDVFHLTRKRLRDQRKVQAQYVVGMRRLLDSLESRFGAHHPAVDDARRVLETNYLADSCLHAGVARWVMRDPAAFGL